QAQGAAIRLGDERLDTELAPLLGRLLDDPQALRRMAEAMASLRRPDAARRAADIVADVAKKVT
ncbi:MAG: hypothetical protein IT326_01270, partial [Anaerolineae bacterium]|nr:hypothetical protein [Anaerolineae bacterium]